MKRSLRDALLAEGLNGLLAVASMLDTSGSGARKRKAERSEDPWVPPDFDRPRRHAPSRGCRGTCDRSSPREFQDHGPGDQWRLGGVCGIDLGPCPPLSGLFSDGLFRELTDEEVEALHCEPASVERGEVLDLLLPQFASALDLCGLGEETARERVKVADFAEGSGLFFDELVRDAGGLAVRTLYAHATFLDDAGLDQEGEPGFFSQKCKAAYYKDTRKLSAIYQEGIKRKKWKVKLFADTLCGIDARGGELHWPTISIGTAGSSAYDVMARRAWPGSTTAYTPRQTAYLCPPWAAEALLADYYFWWAWRLLDLVNRGLSDGIAGALRDLILAQLCARCGLAEITNLAGILTHEWSHVTGTWKECGSDQVCCHNMLEWFFRHRMTAEYGLPVSHLPDVSRSDRAWSPGWDRPAIWREEPPQAGFPVARFDLSGGWVIELSGSNCPQVGAGGDALGTTPEGASANSYCRATHADLLDLVHQVRIDYGTWPECDTAATAKGQSGFSIDSQTFNRSSTPGTSSGAPESATSFRPSWQFCVAFCNTWYKDDANALADCLANCAKTWDPGLDPEDPDDDPVDR